MGDTGKVQEQLEVRAVEDVYHNDQRRERLGQHRGASKGRSTGEQE